MNVTCKACNWEREVDPDIAWHPYCPDCGSVEIAEKPKDPHGGDQKESESIPCYCYCHVFPGTYPTSEGRPCSLCGHVHGKGQLIGTIQDGWREQKSQHGGARFHPPGRKYGRPPKEVKVKHLRSAIAEPESPEEAQAIEWWKGLSPKERLRMIVNMEEVK